VFGKRKKLGKIIQKFSKWVLTNLHKLCIMDIMAGYGAFLENAVYWCHKKRIKNH
jgi:hypothetical protein